MASIITMASQIRVLINELGTTCQVQKADGTSVRVKSVASTIFHKDAEGFGVVMPTTTMERVYYFPDNMRKAPEVGDDIVFDSDSWSIVEVTEYKIGKTVVAYMAKVDG